MAELASQDINRVGLFDQCADGAPAPLSAAPPAAPMASAAGPVSSADATELFGHFAHDANMCKDPVSEEPAPVQDPAYDIPEGRRYNLDGLKWLGSSVWSVGKAAVDLLMNSPSKGPMLPPLPKRLLRTTPGDDEA